MRTPLPCRSALTSGMALTLSPCKPAAKRKDVPEGGTIEQIEKVRCLFFKFQFSTERAPFRIGQLEKARLF